MRRITFELPTLLVKEGDQYIITCDVLGIYCQASSTNDVQKNFESSVEVLLNKWNDKMVEKLEGLGLLKEDVQFGIFGKKANVDKFKLPHLKTGIVEKAQGELVYC